MTNDPLTTFPVIRLNAKDFRERLAKIKPFMAIDDMRHYLRGVHVSLSAQELTLVATNGHILQEQVFDAETELSETYDDFAVLCPKGAVDHLIKIVPNDDKKCLTMQVIDGGKHIRFDFFEFEYVTATVDSALFPNYQKVMPKGDVSLQTGLNANYFVAALKALGDAPVNISIDDGIDGTRQPHLLTSDDVKGIRCVIMPVAEGEHAE